ncbi:alpha/beta hydrolase family protein [Streptomyces sp. NPDC058045]|uniref:alpha/beta hydrolase family protein n=1 Tax=Streptomyces sp. NPDC058045 TaxID=3346311 RepID=UPI0036DFC5FA
MCAGPAGRTQGSRVPTVTARGGPGPLSAVLRTADGVPVEAEYRPGPEGDAGDAPVGAGAGPGPGRGAGGTGTAIVLAHGFTGDLDRPQVRRVAAVLARRAAVVTFSFRGHGGSGGRSTVGDREVLDLAAAVTWARSLGHLRVVTVGFSMGGSVVLRHGAEYRTPPGAGGPAVQGAHPARDGGPLGGAEDGAGGPGRTGAHLGADPWAGADAVVAVSAPARWYYRGTAPMRRLHWLVTRPLGRLVGRYGFRTRIHHRDWDPVPRSPVESVPLIAPAPLLIVHGDRDPYFPLDHPRTLAAAAAPGAAELWLEHGMGHAEHAATEELLERIGDWIAARTPAARDARPGGGRGAAVSG